MNQKLREFEWKLDRLAKNLRTCLNVLEATDDEFFVDQVATKLRAHVSKAEELSEEIGEFNHENRNAT